jgi:para-aminobenzoate synthetase component 1
MPLVDLGFYDWAIIADHHLKTVTLVSANTQPATKELVKEVISIWQSSTKVARSYEIKSNFLPIISIEEYTNAFGTIQKALKEGRSYQVNYTQPYHAAYIGDAWEIYKKISRSNPVPYTAFIRSHAADILSFSPERLLLYNQGSLLTSPIKGTIHRSDNPIIDEQLKSQLKLSEKNNAENIMIVDLLRHDLGKISQTGTVKVSNLCAIQSYKSVHHLVSDIEAQCIEHLHPIHAFISCFPGGSITGAPKRESMKIIQEQERYARGIYCGSIGYFSKHGRFDTSIAIRTITATQNILHLAAGGGIVIDSQCEDEYRECYTKIAAVVNGLKD